MKKYFFLAFFYCSFGAISQQKLSKEISFVNDNDLYASKEIDQYYSNGMFLSYRYLSKSEQTDRKKIYEIQIGHEMYTPFRSTVISPLQHDRPFAAHLYGSFGITKVHKSKSIFQTKLLLGVVGENALGRELQEFIHDIYNFRTPIGWRYQIQNLLALNIDLEYQKSLGINKKRNLDLNLISKARMGTVYNEITGGFKGRIGLNKLQPMSNSIGFHTHLNNDQTEFTRQAESFFYYQTSLTAVLYDATLQGSLFNDNSPITFEPNRFRFDLEIGFRCTLNRWNLGYAFHYNSNQLPNLRANGGHYYGRLFFGYSFH